MVAQTNSRCSHSSGIRIGEWRPSLEAHQPIPDPHTEGAGTIPGRCSASCYRPHRKAQSLNNRPRDIRHVSALLSNVSRASPALMAPPGRPAVSSLARACFCAQGTRPSFSLVRNTASAWVFRNASSTKGSCERKTWYSLAGQSHCDIPVPAKPKVKEYTIRDALLAHFGVGVQPSLRQFLDRPDPRAGAHARRSPSGAPRDLARHRPARQSLGLRRE